MTLPEPSSDLLKTFQDVYLIVSRLPPLEQERVLEAVGALLGHTVQFFSRDEGDDDADEDDTDDE